MCVSICLSVCPVSRFSLYTFLCEVPRDQKHHKALSKRLTLYFPTSRTLRQNKCVFRVTQFHASCYSKSGSKDIYSGSVGTALGTLSTSFMVTVTVRRRCRHYLHFHLGNLRSKEVHCSHKVSQISRNGRERRRCSGLERAL